MVTSIRIKLLLCFLIATTGLLAKDNVVPETAIPEAKAEVAAVLKEVKAGKSGRVQWLDLVDQVGLKALDLLGAISDDIALEKGWEAGLQTVLKKHSATEVRDYMERLPKEDLDRLMEVFDFCMFRRSEITRKQMLVMYGLGYNKRALFHARNLWQTAQDDMALVIGAMAIRQADVRLQTWGRAGQRLFRFSNLSPLKAAVELSFYIGLAEKLEYQNVVAAMLVISKVQRADAGILRILVGQLMRLGMEQEVQGLLSGTNDPSMMFHVLRLFNKQLETEMPKEDWDKIYAAATGEQQLYQLAQTVRKYDALRANRIYQRILETAPKNSVIDAGVLQELAFRSEMVGDFNKAADLIGQYVTVVQGMANANKQEIARLQLRAEGLRKLPEIDTGIMLTARVAARSKDYSSAIKRFKQILDAHPSIAQARRQLLDVLQQMHDHQSYIKQAKALLKNPPKLPGDNLVWARYAVNIGMADVALRHCAAHLKQVPNAVDVLPVRGAAKELAGRHEEALKDFQAAASKGDDSMPLAIALLHARKGAHQKAIAALRKHLLEVRPDDDYATVWMLLLQARLKQDIKKPAKTFRTARGDAIDPWANSIIAFALGEISEADLTSKANGTTDKLLRRARHCEASFYMGQKALIDGDRAKAKARFEKTISFGIATFIEHRWAKAELTRLQ